MAYPEMLLIPMREDLTKYGVEETRTPAEVDRAIAENGTVLMVINAVCGCAAGQARPAVGMALTHTAKPDAAVTVFAGGDVEATAHLRSKYLAGVPVSSPAVALFREGKLAYMMHRSDIESNDSFTLAKKLTAAFDQHCVGEATKA